MPRVTCLEIRPYHRLFIAFSDGVAGEIDLSAQLFGPMFEPLRDSAYFALATLDEFGAPSWPNGADLAPDAIYTLLSCGHERIVR